MGSVAKDVFISLPLTGSAALERTGAFTQKGETFSCVRTYHFPLALQHVILGKMTHCHSLKDVYCQLIQPNTKICCSKFSQGFPGEKKILSGTQEATHLMFLAAETSLGWNK